MARSLCPDRQRAAIGALAAVLMLWRNSSIAQIAAIALGGLLGLWVCRKQACSTIGHLGVPLSRNVGFVALGMFFLLLVGLPLLRAAGSGPGVVLFEAFYRSGALVFGGGHVVLPLLRDAVVTPGWLSDSTFLAGYGAAQAIPGPLFTFAAYLGALATPVPGVVGAALALAGIFLPGLLILIGTLPFWDTFRSRTDAQAIMRGINAAVVGILGAALYSPLWTSSFGNAGDVCVVMVGFLLLTAWRTPPIVVVMTGAIAGLLLSMARG